MLRGPGVPTPDWCLCPCRVTELSSGHVHRRYLHRDPPTPCLLCAVGQVLARLSRNLAPGLDKLLTRPAQETNQHRCVSRHPGCGHQLKTFLHRLGQKVLLSKRVFFFPPGCVAAVLKSKYQRTGDRCESWHGSHRQLCAAGLLPTELRPQSSTAPLGPCCLLFSTLRIWVVPCHCPTQGLFCAGQQKCPHHDVTVHKLRTQVLGQVLTPYVMSMGLQIPPCAGGQELCLGCVCHDPSAAP